MYKLRNFVDPNRLSLRELAKNPLALDYLEQNPDKIEWVDLLWNPDAIPFILKHLRELNAEMEKNPPWEPYKRIEFNPTPGTLFFAKKCPEYLQINTEFYNPHITEVLDTFFFTQTPSTVNCYSAGWTSLSRYCNNLEFLEANLENLDWYQLSKNPAAVPLLEKYPEKIDWMTIGGNPNAMHLVEANFDLMRAEHCWEPLFEGDGPDEMLWKGLSANPHKKAIDILLQYPQHIDWIEASGNPGAIRLLEKYPEKIVWLTILGNRNPDVLPIIDAYLDKYKTPNSKKLIWKVVTLSGWEILSTNPILTPEFIQKYADDLDWAQLSRNPCIFELDYAAIKRRCAIYKDELLAMTLHPSRIETYLASGFSIRDL